MIITKSQILNMYGIESLVSAEFSFRNESRFCIFTAHLILMFSTVLRFYLHVAVVANIIVENKSKIVSRPSVFTSRAKCYKIENVSVFESQSIHIIDCNLTIR